MSAYMCFETCVPGTGWKSEGTSRKEKSKKKKSRIMKRSLATEWTPPPTNATIIIIMLTQKEVGFFNTVFRRIRVTIDVYARELKSYTTDR